MVPKPVGFANVDPCLVSRQAIFAGEKGWRELAAVHGGLVTLGAVLLQLDPFWNPRNGMKWAQGDGK